jgi:uncharacterized protein (DUF433 family)
MEFLFFIEYYFLYLIKTNKMENLISRITINPEICHGKPTVRNMASGVILDMLGSGMETSEI